MSYADMKAEYMADNPSDDPWGTCLSWHFDLCDYIHWTLQEEVPSAWCYDPGFADRPDDDGRQGTFILETYKDLVKFGNLLKRYADKLRQAGKDY